MNFHKMLSRLHDWWYAGDVEHETLTCLRVRVAKGHVEQRGKQFAWVQDDPGHPPENNTKTS